ncbi:MAG: HNH endonuclease [archaeon]|jgi:hypothetical protein
MKLEIELVPSTSWYSNLRKVLTIPEWNKLREEAYARSNYTCFICGNKGSLHAHEEWVYDDNQKIQTLDKIVALCENCHMIKHAGFSMHTAEGKRKYSTEKLITHFCIVNNCSQQDYKLHENEAFKKFNERSKYQWKFNLANLAQYGIDPKKVGKKFGK